MKTAKNLSNYCFYQIGTGQKKADGASGTGLGSSDPFYTVSISHFFSSNQIQNVLLLKTRIAQVERLSRFMAVCKQPHMDMILCALNTWNKYKICRSNSIADMMPDDKKDKYAIEFFKIHQLSNTRRSVQCNYMIQYIIYWKERYIIIGTHINTYKLIPKSTGLKLYR